MEERKTKKLFVGYGLRNPFRFTVRPGTNDIWTGNVGWDTWESIDRIDNPTAFAGQGLRLAVL